MKLILLIQNFFLGISLLVLMFMPLIFAYGQPPENLQNLLYNISHIAVFFVMSIRPLSNLFPHIRLLAQLVILRKGIGAFSASIIVAFMIERLITDGLVYLSQYMTSTYWSLEDYALLAHSADVCAVLLLITSNNFSRRILKANWKRLQKLAYVYFYAGISYKIYVFHDPYALWAVIIVTLLIITAFTKNRISIINRS